MMIATHRWVVACASMLALAAACGTPAPGPAVSVRIGTFAVQDFLPYFVVREHGLDTHGGLTFVETAFPGGAAAIDAMVAGTLDLCPAVGTVPLLAAAERGLIPDKIVVIAANNSTDPDHRGIAVLAAPWVRRWDQLRGQKIATNARNSITTAAVVGRLRLERVDDVALVEIPFSNMGLALAGGNVAAAAMNEPFLTQSLLRGDGTMLGWVAGGRPFERAPYTSLTVSAEFLRRHPGAVRAYLRAHLAAVAWINANVAPARTLLARRLDLSQDVGGQVNLLRWPDDARHDRASLARLQALLVDLGVLKGSVSADRLYDETLLGQVQAEKGSGRR